ncbi:MAG: ATP synthase subunit I [Candidatus Accumulibacter sp.]|jgi:ATP synthase protein I|nr:ATP synthase subunit I [Accumulibacter sp.]
MIAQFNTVPRNAFRGIGCQVKMFKVIFAQTIAVALASVLGGLIAGSRGGISSALGGAACVLPNLLFALYLKLVVHRSGEKFRSSFMMGELVKLLLIAGLLFIIARKYDDLHMPSLLIGLVLATQALFFLGFWTKTEHVDNGS